MVKKFEDLPDHSFSTLGDITVVCPNCGKAGTVIFDREKGVALFKCHSCFSKKEIEPFVDFYVTGQCTTTGKYFRCKIPGKNVHGKKAKIKCPYCDEFVSGDIDIQKECLVFTDSNDANDPYFHYPLFFQTSFRGRTIWALNREHLQYLIDYLSADLRCVSGDFYKEQKTMRSQSDVLPKFMKTAKNRDSIIKALEKLLLK